MRAKRTPMTLAMPTQGENTRRTDVLKDVMYGFEMFPNTIFIWSFACASIQ